jgi:hypothetical protein
MAAQTLPLRSRAADWARTVDLGDRLSPKLAKLLARQKRSPRGLALLTAFSPPVLRKPASRSAARPFKKQD